MCTEKLLLFCLTENVTDIREMMVVISMMEEWSALKSLAQDSSEDESHKLSFRSVGSNQVCDLTVEDRSISLHYAELKENMTEESICETIDSCFKSCTEEIRTFLLLIQGGCYTMREQRLTGILQAHFGAEALKYLIVLSVEDGKVVDTLDDALLDLINVCDGRYCRVRSSAPGGGLHTLLEMVDYLMTENGVTGYTESVLSESMKRRTEDSAMNMLKMKVREAEEKEQAFMQLLQQQEQRRAKELEDLNAKHDEERKKEGAEQKQYEAKRENLEEAVRSHRAMLQLQISTPDGKSYFHLFWCFKTKVVKMNKNTDL